MDEITKKEQPSVGYRETIFQTTEKYLVEHYDIRYNEVLNDIQYKLKTEKEFYELNTDSLYIKLQNERINISHPKLISLLRSDFIERHNPFQDYFDRIIKLDKSKNEDYILKLSSYVKTKAQERFNRHFKKMMVRSIACALKGNVVNKQAFILVHNKQNSGKTTFLNWLCPNELRGYITENIGIDKDSLIALSENFIINLDELATFSKMEINSFKSMLSKAHVKVRRPFEKKAVVTPRRANFIGSTNKTEFLNDESGSVRWLCFEIERIDWNYSREIEIDLVWAQAYDLYQNKFHYELTAEEIEENEKENKKHQRLTLEMELIQRYYIPGTKKEHDAFYRASDFMKYLPEKLGAPIKTSVENIGKALKSLDFDQGNHYNGRYTEKGYYIKFNSIIDLTQLQSEEQQTEIQEFVQSE
jgi:predicted P-loop ATPase